MKIVLATSNKGKVKEIKELLHDFEVVTYSEIIDEFPIIEDGDTFKDNAIIKAKAVYEALNDSDAVVLADDSGISIDALGGKPGIYSARYAGESASDKDNLYKAVDELKARGISSSNAHYTAAIAIVDRDGVRCVHGWMHGVAISQTRGSNGFGYDPMFIPDGFELTLAELDDSVKNELSHRSKALKLVKILLSLYKKGE